MFAGETELRVEEESSGRGFEMVPQRRELSSLEPSLYKVPLKCSARDQYACVCAHVSTLPKAREKATCRINRTSARTDTKPEQLQPHQTHSDSRDSG